MAKSKNVALVLGSGGARGLAHIGVIEELTRRGYSITSISGSSMGALVGGLLATNKLEEYKNWILKLDKFDILTLIDFTFSSKGIVKGQKVFEKMQELKMIPDISIEELPVPYTAVAVDIINNQLVVFNSGNLQNAIRASISIPSVFTPMPYNGTLLVDGGVLSPLPLEFVKRTKGDLLVAVDLNAIAPYEQVIRLNSKQIKNSWMKDNPKVEQLIDRWDKLFGHTTKATKEGEKKGKITPKSIGYFDLAMRSVQLMQSQLTQYAIRVTPPDALIPISKNSATVFEFYKAAELIEYGRRQCAMVLDEKGL
ncbi:MAG TPA: phospholipase [Bacteroidales bacterium]|nr:phospholipase [Bacteroidales bacterium]